MAENAGSAGSEERKGPVLTQSNQLAGWDTKDGGKERCIITLQQFSDSYRHVDIRKWWINKDGEYQAGKGIALPEDQWEELQKAMRTADAELSKATPRKLR